MFSIESWRHGHRQVGIDLNDVARVLEAEGVTAFASSYDGLLSLLQARADGASAA